MYRLYSKWGTPVPRPNFEGCLFLKKSNNQYITGAAFEPRLWATKYRILNILSHFGHPKVCIPDIHSMWQMLLNVKFGKKNLIYLLQEKTGGASIREGASFRINTVYLYVTD